MWSDIPALNFINCEDFEWADSISVVGNSGILKNRNDASAIDNNDHVMRFNHALVENFEEICGSKTNFRFINEHSLNHSDDNLMQELNDFFPATKKDYVDDFSDLNIIIKFHGETPTTDCQHKIDNICKKNNVATVSPELFRFCSSILGRSPSAGFLGIMIALKYYSKIECFGFNFNQNVGVDKHYFEKSDKTGGTHDFNQEHNFIKNLHIQNQLSLFI